MAFKLEAFFTSRLQAGEYAMGYVLIAVAACLALPAPLLLAVHLLSRGQRQQSKQQFGCRPYDFESGDANCA